MSEEPRADLQRQIDDLVKHVSDNRVEIEALQGRADASEKRADAARDRADAMEAQMQIDREMIAELHADGVLAAEHVAQLETALSSSRMIGAAIGILMESRKLDQAHAFTVLREASQRSNRKLRDLASSIVAGTEGLR